MYVYHSDLSCYVSDCTVTICIYLPSEHTFYIPENFGSLRNLQHLDLLGNKLSMLPVSFWRLEKLKWLDLKDNPLKDELKKLAGDCLNETQIQ
jgi:Leucine-rich repeat (LRR) protein